MGLFNKILGGASAVSNAASGFVGLAQGIQSSFIGASAAEREAMSFNAAEAEKARQFNAAESQLTRDFNAAEARAQRDWTEAQYNAHESMQAKVAEAKAAGINPAAIFGQIAGGSVGSGSAASGSAATSSAASGAAGVNQLESRINPDSLRDSMLLNSSVQSQTRKNEAEARTAEATADIAEYEANVAKAKNNPEYITTQITDLQKSVKANIDNANAQAKLALQRAKTEKQARTIEAARNKYVQTAAQIDILQRAYGLDNFRTRLQLENEKLKAEARLDNATANKQYAEIDKIRSEITKIEQECITLGEQAYSTMMSTEFQQTVEKAYKESGINWYKAMTELTNEKSETERVMRPVYRFQARAQGWSSVLQSAQTGYDIGSTAFADFATGGASAAARGGFKGVFGSKPAPVPVNNAGPELYL